MAFSNTVLSKVRNASGLVIEKGTWDATGVAVGTIIADTALGSPITSEILWSEFTSNGDHAIAVAADTGADRRKITVTNGDAGTYTLVGLASA